MRTVKFVSREWLLGKARVGNGDMPLIDGKRPFYRRAPARSCVPFCSKPRTAARLRESKWRLHRIGRLVRPVMGQGRNDLLPARTAHLVRPGKPRRAGHVRLPHGRQHRHALRTRDHDGPRPRRRDNPVRVHGSVTEAPVEYTLKTSRTRHCSSEMTGSVWKSTTPPPPTIMVGSRSPSSRVE